MEKLRFAGIENSLSRNEMKKIMAGSSQCNCLYCELSNGGVNTYATNCSSNYPSAYCAWFTGDIFASGSYGIC